MRSKTGAATRFQCHAELSGQAGYNYASSSTVRHDLDAFATKKNADSTTLQHIRNRFWMRWKDKGV